MCPRTLSDRYDQTETDRVLWSFSTGPQRTNLNLQTGLRSNGGSVPYLKGLRSNKYTKFGGVFSLTHPFGSQRYKKKILMLECLTWLVTEHLSPAVLLKQLGKINVFISCFCRAKKISNIYRPDAFKLMQKGISPSFFSVFLTLP